MAERELIIVGGANGTGKTTFAVEYASRHDWLYLGADAIDVELAPDAPQLVRVAAAHEFIQRLTAALDAREAVVLSPRLPGALCGTRCVLPAVPDTRSRLCIYSSTPPTHAWSESTNACKKAGIRSQNRISDAGSFAVFATSGGCTDRWPIIGF